jgi:undecaprenyl-diphosphatase
LSLIDALVLGVVQGLTEFLPVSSSGHLAFGQALVPGFRQVGVLFDVMLHVGTLAALLVHYRRLLASESTALVSRDRQARSRAIRLLVLIGVATIPTAVVGLALKKTVESAFENLPMVGVAELATAALLAGTVLRRRGAVSRDTMTVGQALVIGSFQGLAVLPGLSRSGSTIAAALFLGCAGAWAADFAFLLAIPGIAGAALVENLSAFRRLGGAFFESPDFVKYCVGAAAAGAVGYVTIGWMIRLVSGRRVHYFAIYCALFGIFLLLAFGGGPPGA